MDTDQAKMHRESQAVEMKIKDSPPLLIKAKVFSPQVSLCISSGREGDDTPRSLWSHLHHMRVIAIENAHPRRNETPNQFCFCIANALNRAEATQVRMPHHEFNGCVRGRDTREVINVTGPRRSHLEDQVTRRFIGTQNCQGKTDLVIERQLRSNRWCILAHDCSEKILCRGFTSRTRHCDHIQRLGLAQLAEIGASKLSQGEG